MNNILGLQQRNSLLIRAYATIDTEYRSTNNTGKQHELFAVAIVDSQGNVMAKHESDFSKSESSEKDLVIWTINQMLKYQLTIGWYSKGIRFQKPDKSFTGRDSDLKVIYDACRYYDLPSIIAFDDGGIPYVRGCDYRTYEHDFNHITRNRFSWYYHIDLYQVYKKPVVKSAIFQNKYKDLSLDSVSKALLNDGKYQALDGAQIQQLPKDKQLEYVIQDAALVMKLSMHNNYEILDLMNAISVITKVPFERVCHTGVSNWWSKIISDKIRSNECRSKLSSVEKQSYKGGHVIEPIVGYYKEPVYVLDVKSLYPTVMIINNISFETVNCECCKYDQKAKVSNDIMKLINEGLPVKQRRKENYWICKDPKYTGIVPRLLREYSNERFRQQNLGKNSMQLALKNLINSIYGLCGSTFFRFSDYRVAELTTAFGRQTLAYMRHIAEEVYDFKVIYGDTDSIFIANVKTETDINRFLAECSIVLEDIEIEVFNIYAKTLILKKKHYIGIPQEQSKTTEIKGMEGVKSDRPLWINNLQRDFVDDLRYERNPITKLRKAYLDMEHGQVPIESLAISITLSKNPKDYTNNTFQKIIGNQANLIEGDSIRYFKSTTKGGAHINPDFISRTKYLEMLRATFENQLKMIGYDFLVDVVGVTSLVEL